MNFFEMNYAEAERFGAFLVRSAFLVIVLVVVWLLMDAHAAMLVAAGWFWRVMVSR